MLAGHCAGGSRPRPAWRNHHTWTTNPLNQWPTEEARIRAAYAKRQGDFRYSWFNPGHLLMTQQQERRLMALLKQRGLTSLDTMQILEIGCGTGYWLREFIPWGAQPENVTRIDLLPDHVAEARRLSPETVRVDCGSAVNLDFPMRLLTWFSKQPFSRQF
jgi:SAM-dependent methyltransferase